MGRLDLKAALGRLLAVAARGLNGAGSAAMIVDPRGHLTLTRLP